MGLSIYYKGLIDNTALIPQLVDEVKEVCAVFGWPYTIIADNEFDGILFSPNRSEPVWLTFNNQGGLRCIVTPDEEWAFTKTQFAGEDVHMCIIKFLRHVKQRYISNFELIDDGYYWQSNDETILRQQFSRHEAAMDIVVAALTDFKAKGNEDSFSLAKRLEDYLSDRLSSETE